MKNYNIAAKKKKDDILFLRKIVPGGAQASYGIEVAKLAGVPDQVSSRAKVILAELEAGRPDAPRSVSAAAEDQLSLGDMGAAAVADVLRRTDVDTLTPIEAMNLLYQLKKEL